MTTTNTLTKRTMHKIDDQLLSENMCHWNILRNQMKLLHIKNISRVFQNQKKAAHEIIHQFSKNDETLMVMAVGLTQSGKTGVMYSIIQEFTSPDTDEYVPTLNVYIITGLSSKEWKSQTQKRILKDNIYHRSDMKEFMKSIKNKKNILILFDEVQIACKSSQKLAQSFHKCGLLNKQFLMENDIKMVEFSATPNGTLLDSELWGSNSSIVKVDPGKRYVSCFDLVSQNRVFDCKPLCHDERLPEDQKQKDIKYCLNNIEDIQKEILQRYDTPRYHFIRTKTGDEQDHTVQNFLRVFGEEYDYIFHDCENESNVDKFLDESCKDFIGAPKKHAFIFLKEMARCAKTYKKKYIGVWYERCVNNFNDDIVIQGLLGRATGYDDNGDSIVYTNIDSIDRYRELWMNGFSKEIEWNSNSTYYSRKKKKTTSRLTINSLVHNGDDKPMIRGSPVFSEVFPRCCDQFLDTLKPALKERAIRFKDKSLYTETECQEAREIIRLYQDFKEPRLKETKAGRQKFRKLSKFFGDPLPDDTYVYPPKKGSLLWQQKSREKRLWKPEELTSDQTNLCNIHDFEDIHSIRVIERRPTYICEDGVNKLRYKVFYYDGIETPDVSA
jgi:transcription antitermination factor NusG